MEVTNDKLLGAFKIKIPLRAFISGCADTLRLGSPAIAFTFNRYTRGLVQVYEPSKEATGKLTHIKGAEKVIKFIVRTSNKIIFTYTFTSYLEIINLQVDDPPEMKLIKHILRFYP